MAVSSLVAAGGGVKKYVQTFNSSGTFTLPAGYDAGNPLNVAVVIVGGGAGGGSGCIGTDGYFKFGGGGGGSGLGIYLENLSLTANQTVTIGAGGAGGAARAANTNQPGALGSNGGNTSFGSYVAHGGGGGGAGGGVQVGGGPVSASILNTFYGSLAAGAKNNIGADEGHQGTGGPGGSSGGAGSYSGNKGGSFGGYDRFSTVATGNSSGIYFIPVLDGPSRALTGASQVFNFASANYNTDINGYVTTMPVNNSGGLWYVPGGGGGAGASYNTRGCGGFAGTLISGGARGDGQSTATSITGETAAANTGAGGGGGGGGVNAVTSGAGGTGGSGYVQIIYWA